MWVNVKIKPGFSGGLPCLFVPTDMYWLGGRRVHLRLKMTSVYEEKNTLSIIYDILFWRETPSGVPLAPQFDSLSSGPLRCLRCLFGRISDTDGLTDWVETEVLTLSGSDRAADLTSSSDLFHAVLAVGGASLAADVCRRPERRSWRKSWQVGGGVLARVEPSLTCSLSYVLLTDGFLCKSLCSPLAVCSTSGEAACVGIISSRLVTL